MNRIVLVSLLVLLAASSIVAAALADGFQTTSPDACKVLSPATVRSALGKGVASHQQRFELPDLPAADQDLNHFLDVSHTGCTWIAGSASLTGQFAAVNVQVYQRNTSYSGGGEPWSPDDEAVAFVRGSQTVPGLNNNRIAKLYKAPWLLGNDVWVEADRKTGGKRIAKIAIRRGDELFIVFSVLTRGRDALPLAVRVAKG